MGLKTERPGQNTSTISTFQVDVSQMQEIQQNQEEVPSAKEIDVPNAPAQVRENPKAKFGFKTILFIFSVIAVIFALAMFCS